MNVSFFLIKINKEPRFKLDFNKYSSRIREELRSETIKEKNMLVDKVDFKMICGRNKNYKITKIEIKIFSNQRLKESSLSREDHNIKKKRLLQKEHEREM